MEDLPQPASIIYHFLTFLLFIYLVLYTSKLESYYPEQLRNLIEEPWLRGVLLLLIVLVSYYSFPLALLLCIVMVLISHHIPIIRESF